MLNSMRHAFHFAALHQAPPSFAGAICGVLKQCARDSKVIATSHVLRLLLGSLSLTLASQAWSQTVPDKGISVDYLASGNGLTGQSGIPFHAKNGRLYIVNHISSRSAPIQPGGHIAFDVIINDASTGSSRYQGDPVLEARAKTRIMGAAQSNASGFIYAINSNYTATVYNADNSTSQEHDPSVLLRLDDDGTHPLPLTNTLNEFVDPNGVLLVERDGEQDVIYGLDQGPKGYGRLFRVDQIEAGGRVTTVVEFTPNAAGLPQIPGGMIRGSDGALYGLMAYQRGTPFQQSTPSAPDTPTGMVWRIDAATNKLDILTNFTLAQGEVAYSYNGTDKITRQLSWVAEGPDGYLYGSLGLGNCLVGSNSLGVLKSPLCDGYLSQSGLNQWDTRYGPYPYYDGPNPYGALYRVGKNGQGFALLHQFNETDGANPRGPLALGPDGNIYGTTISGGANRNVARTYRVGADYPGRNAARTGDGTLFRIVPSRISINTGGTVIDGGFEHLHDFKGGVGDGIDGKSPLGVVAGLDGKLYGGTLEGGRDREGVFQNNNDGTLFRISFKQEGPQAFVSVSAESPLITLGQSVVFDWSSAYASNCVGVGGSPNDGWQGVQNAQGKMTITPSAAGIYYYSLQCDDDTQQPSTTKAASNIYTLRVDVEAEDKDGNTVEYGNGGGALAGDALAALAALGAAVGWRRHRNRSHSRKGQHGARS